MHSQMPSLAHRDIKVENILLQNKNFKLCDFGSASTDTLDYTTCSKNELVDRMELFEKYTTLMYRPPEMIDQYLKFAVTAQVDVWMLGCVLYTLCFARHQNTKQPNYTRSKLQLTTKICYAYGSDRFSKGNGNV